MRRAPAAGLLAAAAAASVCPARALPSFAAQTGQPCTSCHVGAFGPQLTPYGRQFKLGGYVQDGGDGWAADVPLAGLAQGSFTRTAKGQPGGAAPGYAANDNFAVDQVSLFLAGRLTDHLGAFVQGTYSGTDRAFRLDNTDVRVTDARKLDGADIVLGLDLNNNPTVQDAYNSTYAWGYPYIASSLAPAPAAAPLLAGGLAGNVLGLTGYLWYDQRLLVEAGGYATYGPSLLKLTGDVYGPGASRSIAPYGRAAYEWNWSGQSAHLGSTFLYGDFSPAVAARAASGGAGRDSYLDVAVDGGYQYLGDHTNIVSLDAVVAHEDQDLRGTVAIGGAAIPRHRLEQVNLNLSYYYQETYGLTLGWSEISGSRDPGLYAPAPISGSRNGKPNSRAFIIEADWIPFGKDESWGAPFANLKLGFQATIYAQFNGSARNYDGFGRSASGDNSLFLFAWLAF